MKKEEFASRLRRETDYMKRKICTALAFALAAVMLVAVALAAANRWGILDFVGRYQDVYIPNDAASYVQTDVMQMQDDRFTVNVREQYYDGRTARFVVDVTPRSEKTLLTGVDTMLTDNWQNLWRQENGRNENDRRTVLDIIGERGYTDVYNLNVWAESEEQGIGGGSMDFYLNEDGTMVVYKQMEFEDDLPTREIKLKAGFTPFAQPLEEGRGDYSQRVILEQPLTLTAAVDATIEPAAAGAVAGAWVNTEPVDYPQAGVRVDRLLIEVKPQEIYATVDFTVVDQAAYAKTDDGLYFEFIDPDSKETEPYKQRLMGGLKGGGGVRALDDAHYRQTETLGRNELRDVYTLRAFECWEKQRFDTGTFAMRPATEEDLAE